MAQTILILGGTGMLGAPVARRLHADGFNVRLLVRGPAKAREAFGETFTLIEGDVTDCAILDQAMAGCDGVHVSVGGPVDYASAENVAALASYRGVKRVTYVSGSTVHEKNHGFPMVQQKLMAENAIRNCGVPYTIFCPTWPMEQLPRFVRDGRATLIGDLPLPFHWFAADDFAAMVSAAYQREEAADKRFYVHGPQAILMKDAMERYCHALHPEIKGVSVLPLAVARTMAIATGNDGLKFAADLMAYFKKAEELGDPTEANQILGAPTTTLDAWIAQRKLIPA
ncbi:MAG: NAD(P)H-binding protein [Anaerolineae bacterium]|nr:NAD(P)H-binding protein [Anaerolineae bacterium]